MVANGFKIWATIEVVVLQKIIRSFIVSGQKTNAQHELCYTGLTLEIPSLSNNSAAATWVDMNIKLNFLSF